MMNVCVGAHDARFLREAPNNLLRCPSSFDLLLEICQGLDEKTWV
jgi:hypothetical protein